MAAERSSFLIMFIACPKEASTSRSVQSSQVELILYISLLLHYFSLKVSLPFLILCCMRLIKVRYVCIGVKWYCM